MNRSLLRITVAALAGAAILSGCDTLPLTSPNATPAPAPAPLPPAHSQPRPAVANSAPVSQAPVISADQLALKEGIELYNKGSYSEAIKRLGAPEMSSGSKASQVLALKYTAFSYCVSSRQTLCRQAFDKAFKLDPAFDLQPGEHGHPLWGPVFAKAKKAK
ncbi:MAG: TssQ family T6SS-associated lipoprotein [Pseudomonadota bacterium]